MNCVVRVGECVRSVLRSNRKQSDDTSIHRGAPLNNQQIVFVTKTRVLCTQAWWRALLLWNVRKASKNWLSVWCKATKVDNECISVPLSDIVPIVLCVDLKIVIGTSDLLVLAGNEVSHPVPSFVSPSAVFWIFKLQTHVRKSSMSCTSANSFCFLKSTATRTASNGIWCGEW